MLFLNEKLSRTIFLTSSTDFWKWTTITALVSFNKCSLELFFLILQSFIYKWGSTTEGGRILSTFGLAIPILLFTLQIIPHLVCHTSTEIATTIHRYNTYTYVCVYVCERVRVCVCVCVCVLDIMIAVTNFKLNGVFCKDFGTETEENIVCLREAL